MIDIPGVTAVPPDFPREAAQASLTGAQPKLAVVRNAESGQYVSSHDSVHVAERYAICTDLAAQLVEKCTRNRATKYQHLSEEQILGQLSNRLLQSGWGSRAEMKWTICKTAEMLGWCWPNCESPS